MSKELFKYKVGKLYAKDKKNAMELKKIYGKGKIKKLKKPQLI